nr:hypothetical protein BaRGS_031877 [Batillaria attramentaria]
MAVAASSSSPTNHHPHPCLRYIPTLLILLTTFPHLPVLVDGAATETPASQAVVSTFDTPYASSNFIHLTVNKETQTLYIGAVNYLYSLYPNLTRWQKVQTGPKLDNPECPPPMPQFQECSSPKKEMPSYNKALVVDYVNKRLIACSSLFHGFCEKRDLNDIEKADVPSYVPVVANNKNASTVAYIAPGPADSMSKVQPNVLYVSVSWSRTGQTIWRERVPAFASRNLDDFDLAYKDNFRQTHIKIEIQQLESFPVKYLYGFSSDGFSYMITIQKRSANSEEYISKIFRVCQNDRNFYSYVEVELRCSDQDTEYNLVQAAFLGKSGKKLAQDLTIPTTEDVLYTVFSKGHDSSSVPTSESALCVFPMRDVRRKFTENIQKCFDGIGNTGPDHISKPLKCLRNSQTRISDDYCGTSDVNQPIGGSDPVKSEPALKFPSNTNVSAIAVSITEEYTVAFVGTSNGCVIKVSVEPDKNANIYETVSVQPSIAVKKDLLFDEEQEHLPEGAELQVQLWGSRHDLEKSQKTVGFVMATGPQI